MKTLLQSEKTISDRELANNQKYLIDLITKLGTFGFRLPQKAKATESSIEYLEAQADSDIEINSKHLLVIRC